MMIKFNEHLENIEIYEAGKPIELVVRDFGINPANVIKMASNENPFGMSPVVSQAIAENSWKGYLYPDDSMFQLKKDLAKKFNVNEKELIIGSGSDQVLEFIARAKLNTSSTVLMNKITFAMYGIYAKQSGASIIKTNSLYHDLSQFLDLYREHKPDIIYICTPNNPTGEAISQESLFNFLDQIDINTLIVIDGAYMEYAKYLNQSFAIEPKELIEKYPNTIYLGTFSKAYGLGGMRVGYGIAKTEIIRPLLKVRPPFNIATLSMLSAIEALKDEDFVIKSIQANFIEMERYEKFLREIGWSYIKSATNFITISLPDGYNSTTISDKLLQVGIIVRNLKGYGLNAVRITIGKKEDNSRLFATIRELL